ncbi:DNA/RNA nuclease SfsA [Desulfosporosinus nitroreducens]|uniref:Sugar fermentation stimulation protein homolog n=1 Tax=Desulfosporosinus nitroreducens TaxID=2018668 RepID=A0ABT8QT51_9FIRM|nr:DNA/RNA nuclease SfsA [Desulfosporosinus nitroreducens]MCO1602957.1 DNA/RNA nuclease SfsA [Desulfosporosinus nitroreducens]MDO0823815.1 DNA/RNA nuclease SfsA [Desulfosporosinus nitroreducens]
MKYTSVKVARFIRRPNRFIAHVMLDNNEEIVHVKNTGRCREILQEGTVVILEEAKNTERKTKYSLIACYKGNVLINIDSQIPNLVVFDGIKEGKIKEFREVTKLSKEVVYGNSRFDLYFETNDQRGFIEVKGVTLETEGIAMFPDAPTQRGCKHIYEMIKAVEDGYAGFIFFLVQMKGVKYFTPFEIRDPEFTKALKLASEKGVTILAYDSIVSEDGITIGSPVEVRLKTM